MPSSVEEHYGNLLAEHYDWMFGLSFEAKVAEQKALIEELTGAASPGSLAVDLGCGSGFQTVALRELGYDVLAIDTSYQLLAALGVRSAARGVTVAHADLLTLDSLVNPATLDTAVCMGDTLTHLSNQSDVVDLFRSVARALKSGGRFVLTYRDLAAGELRGLDRFIPVRSDKGRIMTCFLEYETAQTVIVHDLVNVREANGTWTLAKSCYVKLRLPVDWVCNELAAAGLEIITRQRGRLITVVAAKPSA